MAEGSANEHSQPYAIDAENDLNHNEARKRMRTEVMEDVCMNEVANLSFDHHQLRKTSDMKKSKDLELGTGWKRANNDGGDKLRKIHKQVNKEQ